MPPVIEPQNIQTPSGKEKPKDSVQSGKEHPSMSFPRTDMEYRDEAWSMVEDSRRGNKEVAQMASKLNSLISKHRSGIFSSLNGPDFELVSHVSSLHKQIVGLSKAYTRDKKEAGLFYSGSSTSSGLMSSVPMSSKEKSSDEKFYDDVKRVYDEGGNNFVKAKNEAGKNLYSVASDMYLRERTWLEGLRTYRDNFEWTEKDHWGVNLAKKTVYGFTSLGNLFQGKQTPLDAIKSIDSIQLDEFHHSTDKPWAYFDDAVTLTQIIDNTQVSKIESVHESVIEDSQDAIDYAEGTVTGLKITHAVGSVAANIVGAEFGNSAAASGIYDGLSTLLSESMNESIANHYRPENEKKSFLDQTLSVGGKTILSAGTAVALDKGLGKLFKIKSHAGMSIGGKSIRDISVTEAISSAKAGLKNLRNNSKVFENLKALWKGEGNGFNKILKTPSELKEGIIRRFTNRPRSIKEFGKMLKRHVGGGLTNAKDMFVEVNKYFWSNAKNRLVNIGKGIGSGAVKAAKGTGNFFVKAAKGIGNGAVKAAKGTGNFFVKAAKGTGNFFVKAGKGIGNFFVKAGKGIGNFFVKAGKGIGTNFTKAKNWLRNYLISRTGYPMYISPSDYSSVPKGLFRRMLDFEKAIPDWKKMLMGGIASGGSAWISSKEKDTAKRTQSTIAGTSAGILAAAPLPIQVKALIAFHGLTMDLLSQYLTKDSNDRFDPKEYDWNEAAFAGMTNPIPYSYMWSPVAYNLYSQAKTSFYDSYIDNESNANSITTLTAPTVSPAAPDGNEGAQDIDYEWVANLTDFQHHLSHPYSIPEYLPEQEESAEANFSYMPTEGIDNNTRQDSVAGDEVRIINEEGNTEGHTEEGGANLPVVEEDITSTQEDRQSASNAISSTIAPTESSTTPNANDESQDNISTAMAYLPYYQYFIYPYNNLDYFPEQEESDEANFSRISSEGNDLYTGQEPDAGDEERTMAGKEYPETYSEEGEEHLPEEEDENAGTQENAQSVMPKVSNMSLPMSREVSSQEYESLIQLCEEMTGESII